MTLRHSNKLIVKVIPVWIAFPDQFQFPRALPFLQLFFPGNCRGHVFKLFKMYQSMNLMLFRKALDNVIFVFKNSLDQITGDADIKCSVSFTGENVDAW